MGPSELLEHVVSVFERLGIPYLVTGSVAAMAYGEPRLTNDIDIVAGIAEQHIPALREAFPDAAAWPRRDLGSHRKETAFMTTAGRLFALPAIARTPPLVFPSPATAASSAVQSFATQSREISVSNATRTASRTLPRFGQNDHVLVLWSASMYSTIT